VRRRAIATAAAKTTRVRWLFMISILA